MSNTTDQLLDWVKGNSHHSEDDQCVPDFSCCTKRETDVRLKARFLTAFAEDDFLTMVAIRRFYIQLNNMQLFITYQDESNAKH